MRRARVINMREGQLQTALDVLCHKTARAARIPLFQRFKYRAMSLVSFFHQFLIMTEAFHSKDARVNVAVSRKFGQARIASSFNDGHMKSKV